MLRDRVNPVSTGLTLVTLGQAGGIGGMPMAETIAGAVVELPGFRKG